MPPTGSTFTDWQQVERESRVLLCDEVSWSEPPQRRRRRVAEEPIRASRRAAVLEREREPAYESEQTWDDPAVHSWDQPTETHSHFDELMAQWNAVYGDGAARDTPAVVRDTPAAVRDTPAADARAFDLSDPGNEAPAQDGRRTVVITGHGDERYMPALRRRRQSELRLHERAGFSPDRAGLWAVLLGVALLLGAIVH